MEFKIFGQILRIFSSMEVPFFRAGIPVFGKLHTNAPGLSPVFFLTHGESYDILFGKGSAKKRIPFAL